MSASTNWREQVSADEAQAFEQFRGIMRTIQLKNSAQSGPGRGLHRKAPLSVQARFEVLDRLPAHARQGLFARPAAYDAWVRLSNAAPAVQPDRATDVRGFAIKVWGVHGAGALGNSTECQDFLLFNLPAFPFPTPDEFVGLMQAQVAGGSALFKYLLKRYGLFRALGYLRRLSRKRPFAGFAGAPFFSGAPFACGPYAAKMRMLPARPDTQPGNPEDLGADFLAALKRRPSELRHPAAVLRQRRPDAHRKRGRGLAGYGGAVRDGGAPERRPFGHLQPQRPCLRATGGSGQLRPLEGAGRAPPAGPGDARAQGDLLRQRPEPQG